MSLFVDACLDVRCINLARRVADRSLLVFRCKLLVDPRTPCDNWRFAGQRPREGKPRTERNRERVQLFSISSPLTIVKSECQWLVPLSFFFFSSAFTGSAIHHRRSFSATEGVITKNIAAAAAGVAAPLGSILFSSRRFFSLLRCCSGSSTSKRKKRRGGKKLEKSVSARIRTDLTRCFVCFALL